MSGGLRVLQDLGPGVGLLSGGVSCWLLVHGTGMGGSCASRCQTPGGGEMAAALGTPEVLRADQRAAESSGVPANPLLFPRQRPHQRQQEGPGTRQAAWGQGAGDLLLLASRTCSSSKPRRVRAAPLGHAIGAGSEGEHWYPGPAGAGMRPGRQENEW